MELFTIDRSLSGCQYLNQDDQISCLQGENSLFGRQIHLTPPPLLVRTKISSSHPLSMRFLGSEGVLNSWGPFSKSLLIRLSVAYDSLEYIHFYQASCCNTLP